jgi:hypothetical protein
MEEYLGARRTCLLRFLKNQAQAINNLTAQNNERQISLCGKLDHLLTILKAKPAVPTPEVSRPSFRDQHTNIFKLKLPPIEDAFGIHCLLKDVTILRLHVKQLWRDFKLGVTGLQAASLTTNAVLAMIKNLVTEFMAAFSKFKSDGEGAMHITLCEHLQYNYDVRIPREPFLSLEDDRDFSSISVPTALCCVLTHVIDEVYV